MSDPLVSILMPAWNVSQWIGQSIESIIEQTYTNLEVIIVDDGSTDNTLEIVRGYDDPRISVYTQEHDCHSWAFNHALSKATGTIIGRQDCDDWSHTERIEKQLAALGDADVVSCRIQRYDKDRLIDLGDSGMIPEEFAKPNGKAGPAAGTIMATRAAFDRVGNYSMVNRLAPDTDWLMRALVLDDPPIEWAYVDEILYTYRIWPGQAMANPEGPNAEHRELLKQYQPLIRERLGV